MHRAVDLARLAADPDATRAIRHLHAQAVLLTAEPPGGLAASGGQGIAPLGAGP